MTSYIKKPHTAVFIDQTGCRKTRLVLEMIEKEYNKHFDYIIIICPTLQENNKTCHAKEWIKNDDKVGLSILRTFPTNKRKSCQNYYVSSKYYS